MFPKDVQADSAVSWISLIRTFLVSTSFVQVESPGLRFTLLYDTVLGFYKAQIDAE
jgi:hypothetical protein